MKLKCATCQKEVPSVRPHPSHFPFCSERCQLADLGKWLDEEYRVSEPAGTADQSPSSSSEGE
jgi:endogenous inhibitor of DNA gyrase (YacG/DUF329 family)